MVHNTVAAHDGGRSSQPSESGGMPIASYSDGADGLALVLVACLESSNAPAATVEVWQTNRERHNNSCVLYCRENSVYIQMKGYVLKRVSLGNYLSHPLDLSQIQYFVTVPLYQSKSI